MLELQATIQGDKELIRKLQRLNKNVPRIIQRGLGKAARQIHRESFALLSGPGSKKSRKAGMPAARPGSYPVPVVSGHLRRNLDFVLPGRSKTSNKITFAAGKLEAIVFNSARYSEVIHEGKRSSAKYGRRPYMTDAVQKVDAEKIMDAEIQKELP